MPPTVAAYVAFRRVCAVKSHIPAAAAADPERTTMLTVQVAASMHNT